LSGFFDSLSSAGHVCCAKPNHGFFQCQHFRRIIFKAPRGSFPPSPVDPSAATIGIACPHRIARRAAFYKNAFFQCFYLQAAQATPHADSDDDDAARVPAPVDRALLRSRK
jgi:hypothetical protein